MFFLFCQPSKTSRNQKTRNQNKNKCTPGFRELGPVCVFCFFGFSFCVFWCFVFCLFGFTSLGGFARRKQKFLKSRSRHRDTVIELGIDIGEVSIPCTVVDVYTGNTAICALPLWHVL